MYLDGGTLVAILFLTMLLCSAWFWSDSLRARERMLETCTRLCQESGLQFLDDTVTLASLRLGRSATGWPEFTRRYVFEFSGTGQDRRQGRATLAGPRVIAVQLDRPDGTDILAAGDPVSPKAVRGDTTQTPGGHDRPH